MHEPPRFMGVPAWHDRCSRARMRITTATILFVSAITACGPSPSAEPEPTSGQTIAASDESERELGVTRWRVSDAENDTTYEGLGADDNSHAEVRIRGVDVDGIRWVEIASATHERAGLRFRVEGNRVVFQGIESLRTTPSAWRAAARLAADHRARPMDGLAASSLSSELFDARLQFNSKDELVHDLGACLTFAGDMMSTAGNATGNQTLSTIGDCCALLGQSMSCYNNYGGGT